MKSKWVAAFKSINGGKQEPSAKNGSPPILENYHVLHEYTYKKMTPCDVCSEVLRGHSRQGLRCKLCRTNIHTYCQEKVGRCQSKTKLLTRRQTCATDMVSRVEEEANGVSPVKYAEKTQSDKSLSSPLLASIGSENVPPLTRAGQGLIRGHSQQQLGGVPPVKQSSGWRRRLTKQQDSVSLDLPDISPDSDRGNSWCSSSSRASRSNGPSSPTYFNQHLLGSLNRNISPVRSHHSSNRGLRPDRFHSSSVQSGSPQHFKSQPTLYVVLHSFKARRVDDLGLKAGSTVHILDTSDSDWWKGHCPVTGSVGYLPSTYLAHLRHGERVHRVRQLCSLNVMGGDVCSLARDQIVIEMAGEVQERLGYGERLVRTCETSHPVLGYVQARHISIV